MKNALNLLAEEIHEQNKIMGWYRNLDYEKHLNMLKKNCGFDEKQAGLVLYNLGIHETCFNPIEKLALIHSEASEALEGLRKNLMDDKLPHRTMFETELADVIIRTFDLAGAMNIKIGDVIEEKLAFNKTREDHKLENRMKDSGKRF